MARSPENASGRSRSLEDAKSPLVSRRTALRAGLRVSVAALFASGCRGCPITLPDPLAALQERKKKPANDSLTPEQRKALEEQLKKEEQARFEIYRKEVESRGSRLIATHQMMRITPGTTVEASLMASQGWRLLIVTERNTGETWILHYHNKTSLSPLAFKPCEDLALTLIGYDPEFEKTLKRLGIQRDLIRNFSEGSEFHDTGVKIVIEPCEITKTIINKKEEWVNHFTAEGFKICVTETDSLYPYAPE